MVSASGRCLSCLIMWSWYGGVVFARFIMGGCRSRRSLNGANGRSLRG
jgi:hypothetical protein